MRVGAELRHPTRQATMARCRRTGASRCARPPLLGGLPMNALLLASALAMATGDPGQTHDHSPKLGKVAFPATCSAAAQGLLERGLSWLHSFEYERSESAFREAAAADPSCAIAHWGVAMSNYHPLWAPPTP